VVVASGGGASNVVPALVVSKREFVGNWEYLLDEAIYTSPPHPSWSGAALINREGKLIGVGSLIVGDAAGTNNNPVMYSYRSISEPTANELALAVDQCGPAPGRMRRRGVDRLVEQIFQLPTNSRLLTTSAGTTLLAPPPLATTTTSFSLTSAILPNVERFDLEWLDRAQQTKARLVIIADDTGREGAPVVGGDLGRIGLDHQIADRQDEPVGIDQDAGAFAIAPRPCTVRPSGLMWVLILTTAEISSSSEPVSAGRGCSRAKRRTRPRAAT